MSSPIFGGTSRRVTATTPGLLRRASPRPASSSSRVFDTVAGFAQAIVKLRDLYAPNVILSYALSYWGTKVDPIYQKPSDTEIDALANRSARFFNSLGASFDLA